MGFDRDGIKYAAKLFALILVIFAAGNFSARSFGDFIYDLEMARYIPPMVSSGPPRPVYEELSQSAAIYSSGRAILAKRDELARAEKDFILADLSTMEISIYSGGVLRKTFAIRSKGKEGGFFETPSGVYRINYKEKNHFSSIGEVWMPWSMHFFGNYFIHGWPYYPGGSPVAESYSGGCIRLSDDDALEIFKFADSGTPLLVYAGAETPVYASSFFKKIEGVKKPDIGPLFSAGAVLAADFETGQVLFSKNSDVSFPIASVTKLMSGLAAMETINRFKTVIITKDVLAESGDSAGLLEGEQFRVEDLIYPLLLVSSNDVAKLFEYESFGLIKAMNEKARALGMQNTSFADASGISPENTSSAEDLFKLLQFLYAHKKPIFEVSGLHEYSLESLNKKRKHVWENLSWPHDDGIFVAGKSGKTPEAGETMAGVFRVKFGEFDERNIAIIILQSENREKDIERVRDHLSQKFVYGLAPLPKKGEARPVIIRQGASMFEAWKGLVPQ